MSGKGHSPRPYNPAVFSENYDRIFRKDEHFVRLDAVCAELGKQHSENEVERARAIYQELSKNYEP